jgi:hypothetical protein
VEIRLYFCESFLLLEVSWEIIELLVEADGTSDGTSLILFST